MNKPRIDIMAAFGDLAAKLRRYPTEGLSETTSEELKSLAFLIDECAKDFGKATSKEPVP